MKFIILVTLFASSFAGLVQQQKIAFAAQPAGLTYTSSVVAAQPAAVAVAPAAVAHAPQHYSHSIPAAAIRNVETVGVTKTITPVVTKTTTTQTHSEPAVSIGQVQGYTQSAAGPAHVAPVQYNTQYTSYLNPTVGVNGPVTYAGPAVQHGYAAAVAQPAYAVAAAPAAVAVKAAPAVAAYAQPAGLYSVQPQLAAVQPQFAYGAQLAAVPQLAVAPQYAAVQQYAAVPQLAHAHHQHAY